MENEEIDEVIHEQGEQLTELPDRLAGLSDLQWDGIATIFGSRIDLEDDVEPQFRDWLDRMAEHHGEIAFYQRYGSVRDASPLTDQEAERLAATVFETEPGECFYNAQLAATGGEHQYVEGYAVHQNGHCIPHAWIETNGKVAEITFPAGTDEAELYYGVEYPAEEVRRAIIEREQAAPLVEDPEEYTPAGVEQ